MVSYLGLWSEHQDTSLARPPLCRDAVSKTIAAEVNKLHRGNECNAQKCED